MSDETTTEQLAEIEGQATEYTPPDGWRVLQVGERLRDGDMTVTKDGYCWPTDRVGYFVGSDQRYIRRTESQPVPQPEPEPVQVREGRWRTRRGEIRDVIPTPDDDERATKYPWYDAKYDQTWKNNGRYYPNEENQRDLVEYLGPIEQNGLVRDVTHLLQESGVLDSAKAEQQIEELRSEVAYVQNLLGESRQRVTQLEELVSSLRTINEAQEKYVRAAGRENSDLQHRLSVVADQWAEQADTVRKLRIELDAAQQVPQAVSDRFEEGWDAGTARAVETIAEWLEPIRAVDSEHLANETLQHLPQIMRHLTGLAQD